MPGLSFVYDSNGCLQREKKSIECSLEAVLHDSAYEIFYYQNNDHLVLASTHYKEYPVFHHEDENYFIFLEGLIYEEYDSLRAKLNEITDILSVNDTPQIEPLLDNWLQRNDGDFIVFVLDKKSGKAVLINDALGRLPLYVYMCEGKLIVSRELRFVAGLLPQRNYDRMGIAQHLLFGYSLGQRTIIENVSRALPCLYVQVNSGGNNKAILKYLRTYNFETKKYSNRTVEENAVELEKIFTRACRYRVSPAAKTLLGLSGGLDSRSVAAALQKSKMPFTAVTRLSYSKREKADADLAEVIARCADTDWTLFKYDQPLKGKDLYQIIKRKGGLNNATLKFMAPFLQDILEKHGRGIKYFTGDGGLLLKDKSPIQRLTSEDELVLYTLHKYQVCPLAVVANLTSVPEKEILDELKKHICRYPETALAQKHVHFAISEYSFKWLFEGEDRNRSYFWSVTPFLSIYFFNYALNCPDHQKAFFKLYRKFLHALSGEIASINTAKWGAPIGSSKAGFAVRKDLFGKKNQQLVKFYRLFFKKQSKNLSYNADSSVIFCLKEQAGRCKAIEERINLEYAMDNLAALTREQLDILFTITSSIDLFENGTSILEKYLEDDFE